MKKELRSLLFALSAVTPMFFAVFPILCSASTGYPALSEQINQELSVRDGAFRKKTLLDYLVSVDKKNDISLKEFHGGDDAAARAIGKDKSVLVLHQLRLVIGEKAFIGVARKLSAALPTVTASWEEIRRPNAGLSPSTSK